MVLEAKEKKSKKEKKDKKDKKDKKEKRSQEATEANEDVTLDDLFGDVDDIEVPQRAPSPQQPVEEVKAPEATQPQKEKKEKKGKKSGKEKEKKEKKDKQEDDNTQVGADASAEATGTRVVLPVLPVSEKSKPKKEKDKKDKKDKKSKKEKREREEEVADVAKPAHKSPETDMFEDLFADVPDLPADDKQTEEPVDGAPTNEQADSGIADEVERDPLFDIFEEKEDVAADSAAGTEQAMDSMVPATAKQETGEEFDAMDVIDQAPSGAMPSSPRGPAKKKQKKKQQEEAEPKTILEKWQLVLDTIKNTRPINIKEADCHDYVRDFVQEMIRAAELDVEAFEAGKPMLNKMKLLPKAMTIMTKAAFADMFVTYEGCRAIGLWLRPLPNGAMPNVQLRTDLLNCMMRLPISKESLKTCKDPPLGQIVVNLSKNAAETVGNRITAALLVEKWVKQVLLKKSDSEGNALENAENKVRPMLPRKPPETAESLAQLEVESNKRMHPQIPVVGEKEYVIQPIPVHQPVKRDKISIDTNRGKLGEVLKVLSRPNKKAWRPYAVSVAGKTVNMI